MPGGFKGPLKMSLYIFTQCKKLSSHSYLSLETDKVFPADSCTLSPEGQPSNLIPKTNFFFYPWIVLVQWFWCLLLAATKLDN